MRIKTAVLFCMGVLVLLPVVSVADEFYDETVLRTLELEFSETNWWSLLTANYQSKTNLAATLIVDGVVYEGVASPAARRP